MRPVPRLAATRMNLLRARRQLERVDRGAGLLRRKREALVRELFRLARPAADTRSLITQRLENAYPALLRALAIHGHSGLAAMGWPARDLDVEVHPEQVWGIPVSDITDLPTLRRTPAVRGTAPGSVGPAAAETAARFEEVAELLLEAAPREARLRRLAEALARTSRQVHSLEQRLAPALSQQITRVRRTLDEREREEHLRLKHSRKRRIPSATDRSSDSGRRTVTF